MASYLSKPTQYAAYQPQIDADLYGKMILKKEQDYQEGFQKIQKEINYYGSIPVSSLEEENYLKQKVDSITSELNNNTNVNWGDQSVQQLSSNYIKSIAKDKNIQTGIYNASLLKKHHSKYLADIDKHGEAAVTDNTTVYDRKYNDWYTSGKLGSRVDFSYTPFVDVNKGVTEYLKELHPQSRVTPVLNKDITQPEQTIYTVEGLDPEIVAAEVKAYLDTTPGAKDQLRVSAENRYTGFGPDQYVAMKKAVHAQEMEINTQAIHEKSLQIASVTDSAEKKKLELAIASLNTRNKELKDYNYETDRVAFQEGGEEWKHNTYEAAFTQGIVGKYTYGNKYKVDYSGKLPWERQMEEKKYELSLAEHQLNVDKERIKNSKTLGPDDITAKKELDPTDVGSLYGTFNKNIIDAKNSYTANYINRLGDILKGTPIYNDYFVKEKGTYKLRNNGEDLIQGTNIKAIDYFYNGYRDSNNVYHPGVMDEWMRNIDSGKDFTLGKDGSVKVELDNYTKMKLNELRDQKSLLDADNYVQTHIEEEITKNPELTNLNNIIKNLNTTPGKILMKTGDVLNYTGSQLSNYFKARNEIIKKHEKRVSDIIKAGAGEGAAFESGEILKELENQIYPNYGISKGVQYAYDTDKNVQNLYAKYNSVAEKRDGLANEILKNSGYARQPTLVEWTKQVSKEDAAPYNPTDEQIQGRLQTYIDSKGLNWDTAFDGDSKAKKIIQSKEPINVTYWWDESKGRYGVQVSNASADKPAIMYISQEAATGLKMKPSKPSSDVVYQKMQKYNGSTYRPGQVPTFDNAEYLNTVKGKRTGKDGKEINGNWIYRYHAEDKGADGFHFIVYVTNSETPNTPSEKVNDYLINSTDWEDAKKQFLDKLK